MKSTICGKEVVDFDGVKYVENGSAKYRVDECQKAIEHIKIVLARNDNGINDLPAEDRGLLSTAETILNDLLGELKFLADDAKIFIRVPDEALKTEDF